MPAVTCPPKRARLFAPAVLALALVAWPGTADADDSRGGGVQIPAPTGPSGKVDGDTLSASATGITFDLSRNGRGAAVGPVAAASDWAPPACWYAPKYTPEQLRKTLEPIWAAGSTGSEWDADQRRRFVDGEPYEDFNKENSGEGYFWDSFVDRSFPPGWDKCDRPVFWVDRGDPPPADAVNAVTPEILAALAYAEIRVPATSVTLAPAGTTKVNLPTWAWLDGADFEPVSVTASVPVLGISATTTATPVALRIEPGTPDAETYPASGVCPLTDGRIGEPYARGKAGRTPPCGVRYLRSSGDGSFTLRATLTWRIDWTGSGNSGGDLPDGTFGAPQTVVVQEIQSVNR